MITDFPGLSFQLKIMVWQAAVTIPTERRPLQRREEAPNFLRRPQKSCNSRDIHLQQHEHNAVWFLCSGFKYYAAGRLSSKNTVKHTSTTQYEYSVAGKISSQISLQHEYYAAQTLCSMNTFSQLTRYSPAARATWHQPGCVGVQSTDGKGTSLIQGTKFIQVLCDLHKRGRNDIHISDKIL